MNENYFDYQDNDDGGRLADNDNQLLDIEILAQQKKVQMNLALRVRELTQKRGLLKSHISEQNDRLKSIEKELAHIEKTLIDSMQSTEDSIISFTTKDAGSVKAVIRKSTVVSITDFDALPAEYKVIKSECVPDKIAIKEYLSADFERVLPGAVLEEKSSITVKS